VLWKHTTTTHEQEVAHDMDIQEFLESIQRPLPWGRHLYGIDLPGMNNTAFRVVDFDIDTEVITVIAVGDAHRTQQHVSYLYEIERDVCSCGDIQCEWHAKEED